MSVDGNLKRVGVDAWQRRESKRNTLVLCLKKHFECIMAFSGDALRRRVSGIIESIVVLPLERERVNEQLKE